jgi:adenylosuccinate synthase
MINGISGLAITKLDVLSEFSGIKICTGYKYKGELLTEFPSNPNTLKNCTPIYEEVEGWQEDLSNIKKVSDLPSKTREYLDKIEGTTGVPIWIISIGASREKVIFVNDMFS